MYDVITIKTDGRILRVAMNKQPTLDFIQQAVGGSIEMVPHFIKYEGQPVTVVYANEDARRINRSPPFSALLTLWLSITAAGERGLFRGHGTIKAGRRAWRKSPMAGSRPFPEPRRIVVV